MFYESSQTIAISDANPHQVLFNVGDKRFANWAFIVTGLTNATPPTLAFVAQSQYSGGPHVFTAATIGTVTTSTDDEMMIFTLDNFYQGKMVGLTEVGVSIAFASAPSTTQNLTVELVGYPDMGARS
jgi:hypothetical protein